jgi:LmbE family N-acetylglucosaminyl deacetylase
MRLCLLALSCLSIALAAHHPAQDQGAVGAWQKILKLQTTASVMHTTAHPDDEHGGLLAMLSRGQGATVSMLTLTRGESGDNAIGPELFDAVGLIRTEELRIADRYYGVDRQYFTTAVDYGFSKRLDEALEKWGRERVLGQIVRVIRTERPFVIISRFQGNERDGHGNHQAAGLLTQQAFRAAGDPAMFPEQLAEGLRPWQAVKLYIGGVRANEDWTIRVDTGQYDPVLGESYHTFGRLGLSFQRSQNSGRFVPQPGPSLSYYKRVDSIVKAPLKEVTFFDGIDTTLPGIYRALGRTPNASAEERLAAVARELTAAKLAFTFTEPFAAVPALARALRSLSHAMADVHDADVKVILDAKEQQIQDAIHASLGLSFTAVAQPTGELQATGSFGGGPPAMPPVVPGQTFDVRATFVNRSPMELKDVQLHVEGTDGRAPRMRPEPSGRLTAPPNEPVTATFTLTVPENARPTRPHFSRASIQDTHYTVTDGRQAFPTDARSVFGAWVHYALEPEGYALKFRAPVTRFEPNLPYGHDTRVLAIVPALAVTLSPAHAVAPLDSSSRGVRLDADVLNNRQGRSQGTLTLRVPNGWKISPASHTFEFSRAGERERYAFDVSIPSLEGREYRIEAVATSDGREYREGYTTIRHRDLETRYLYRDAVASVRGIDVKIAPGLKVGYVMGIGDEVPAGIAQLGAEVQLLGAQDLANADLSRFDAIMTGTRAYAVREDLKTYNRRLLEYVRAGGNLIVLYNTQELVPNVHAPYPGELPRNAEEVSEEDSPVEILAADAPVFATPNRITLADFEGWMEQRGSKFWTTWDARYTPMLATWDKGQAPQKGGWLHARYGKGHYTYFAYAFHRQLPYGVPGAYRLLANLLSQK